MKSIIFGTRRECVKTNTESLQVVDRLQSTDFLVCVMQSTMYAPYRWRKFVTAKINVLSKGPILVTKMYLTNVVF